MLGAIAGDIIGSVYEFSNHRNKNFALLFHAETIGRCYLETFGC